MTTYTWPDDCARCGNTALVLERRPGVRRWRPCPVCSDAARIAAAMQRGWLRRILALLDKP